MLLGQLAGVDLHTEMVRRNGPVIHDVRGVCGGKYKFKPVKTVLKPNAITLASSELAPNMFEAGSCQIPLH